MQVRILSTAGDAQLVEPINMGKKTFVPGACRTESLKICLTHNVASRLQVTICEKPYLSLELFSQWRSEEQQTVKGAFLSQVISSQLLHQTSGTCFKTNM